MDADVLVPREFLRVLDRAHARGKHVANMFRAEAPRPCGVGFEDWVHQVVDYESVLAISPSGKLPIPDTVSNKGPLISARREHWQAIAGYDPHRLFSTGYTLFGRDVSLRLRLLLGPVERALPIRCVHPWHPNDLRRSEEIFQVLWNVQSLVMGWSQREKVFDVRSRAPITDALYEEHREALELAIATAERAQRAGARPPGA
jgi:hypothetical protein